MPLTLGVKASARDAHEMAPLAREAGASTLEVHLHARDVGPDRARVVDVFRPLAREFRLVVHQPETAALADGEAPLFVDAASSHEPERARAEAALAAAVAIAREVGARGVVAHPGGVLPAAHAPSREALARTLAAARAAAAGRVEVWLENMPWFYGRADGTWGRPFLGPRPQDLALLGDVVDGYCLDFCHAFLSAPPPDGGWRAVDAFLDALGARVRHAHASGARRIAPADGNPRAGEGIPFREGEMDAGAYARALARLPDGVAVVPEVDGGFRDGGAGFREALAWLRALPPLKGGGRPPRA